MNPFAQWRKDFPMLHQTMHGKPLIYFDTAATALKPQSVIDCLSNFYQHHYGTVHRAVYQLASHATTEYQNARHKVQKLLNAKHLEEIIFTSGTTDAINVLAYSFGKAFLQPGDEILITEMEHHAGIVPWQIVCEDRGASLKVVPFNELGELDLETFKNLLSSKTKIVSIAHISNALGTLNPIKNIIKLAHHHGAKVLIDGAQAVPHMSVDVQDLDADFYVFSGHKLYGPTGIGVLYGKKELLEQLPPAKGGGDMIKTVDFAKTTYNEIPTKFEAGTPPIAQAIGLGAAIDYAQNIGLSAIEQHEQSLLCYATQQMKRIPGLQIIGRARKKGAIISFTIEGTHPLDIATLLDLKGIAIRSGHNCAQPTMKHFHLSATARASFGLYNTKEEIDIFCHALEDVTAQLLFKP